MTTPHFKTNIQVLDKMLGIDKKVEAEINNDRILLIKGGPGSGKTTLGLQILNNHLKRNEEEGSTTFIAGYVSLEIDPELSIEYASKSFQFERRAYKINQRLLQSEREPSAQIIRCYI
jgi:KaiC/GvpD/RAD55 family RecA-like ATPase